MGNLGQVNLKENDMPNKPGDKGFDVDDSKYQPAKLSDRSREGQREGNWIKLDDEHTYGMPKDFSTKDKVTKAGGEYQDFQRGADKGNFSQKNASISRLDLIGKQTANSGTAYNEYPIPEVYKPATSEGVPNADAVEYNTVKKDRNA